MSHRFTRIYELQTKLGLPPARGEGRDLAKNDRVLGGIAELLPLQVIRPMEFVTKIERNLPMPVLLG
jgi:hypothetical protein